MRPKLGRIGPDVPTPRWGSDDPACRAVRAWFGQRVAEMWAAA